MAPPPAKLRKRVHSLLRFLSLNYHNALAFALGPDRNFSHFEEEEKNPALVSTKVLRVCAEGFDLVGRRICAGECGALL